MKNALTTVCLFTLWMSALRSQPGTPYTGPCPFNPDVTVSQLSGWVVYQTTDGHWNGPIDSSRCINITRSSPTAPAVIKLSEIDPDLPLFLRARLDSFPFSYVLQPNYAYMVEGDFSLFPPSMCIKRGSDCPDEVCTAIIVGIAIPDENGTPGAATRYQMGLPAPLCENGHFEDCFPTERFDGQYVRELVLKITLETKPFPSGAEVRIHLLPRVKDLNFPEALGLFSAVPAVSNPMPLWKLFSSYKSIFLGLYTAATYPSPQHLSYIDVFPVPNVSVPRNITVVVEESQQLEMQPFAQFRGGLVEGSDTLRHQYVLLNNGGTLCVGFLDLIFNHGNALHHAGGTIEVHHPYACMQFKKGGEFRIKEGAHLHYGDAGVGMLVICADGSMVLERDATLVLDALLQISECDDALPPSHVDVELPPGARLVFTKHARITNRFSKGQQMRLRVHMRGGTLDDSALPPDSRALIERIYPEPAPQWSDNIRLSPNPFSQRLTLAYTTGQAEERLSVRWFDLSGRFLSTEQLRAVRGYNELALQNLPGEDGLYLLEIQSEQGHRVVQRVFRGH